MSPPQDAHAAAEKESFKQLLEDSLRQQRPLRKGQLVDGVVVARDDANIIIDVGTKAEGSVPLSEFVEIGQPQGPEVGDHVEVLVLPSGDSGLRLSVREARRRAVWERVEVAMRQQLSLPATVLAEVKGGYRVDLGGLVAFMPKSEADIDPRASSTKLLGQECEVAVISATHKPENIVVSRRQPMLEELEARRRALFAKVGIGDRVSGVVRRFTDFGAFVDIGGVDALLHVSDIAWRRPRHPSEVLSIGQKITAEITKLNADTGKVSISMRMLQPDPWLEVAEKYEAGMRLTGTVRRLLDYGAMVELEPGVEGMIHRSEMSWLRKDIKITEVLSEGDVVDVAVLAVDAKKRRISLSLKEVTENPWQSWLSRHPVGSRVTGTVKNITEFGMFVGLTSELDGLVHLSNLSWEQPGEEAVSAYRKGQEVECVVLGVDIERQRISLGIKQLSEDPFEVFLAGVGRGSRVIGKVVALNKGAAEVELGQGIQATLPLKELPREHGELMVGSDIEAKVVDVHKKRRQVTLSVRQLYHDDEREAVRSYRHQVEREQAPSALALELKRKGFDQGQGKVAEKKKVKRKS